MKRLCILLTSIVILLLLNSCQSHHKDAELFFWTERATEAGETVWVDGKEIGSLPSIHDTLINRQLVMPEKQGLRITRPSGEYDVAIQDKNGKIVCKGTVKLDLDGGSTDIHSAWNNDHCKMKVVW